MAFGKSRQTAALARGVAFGSCHGTLAGGQKRVRKTSSTPAVVPGAAPALAKAGVGLYMFICVYMCLYVFICVDMCLYVLICVPRNVYICFNMFAYV